MVELLLNKGETLKKSGSEFEWKNNGGKVTVRGNLWFDQYERVGGNSVDFVKFYFHKTYAEAVEYLLGGHFDRADIVHQKQSNKFDMPKKYRDIKRVENYLLKHRKIDSEVFAEFVKQELIFEEDNYHNAVFVGLDNNGKPCHASKRGTGDGKRAFKGTASNSIAEYSFHWVGKSDKLYVFEAPIDLLSFISLNKDKWKSNSYIACCSVSDRPLMQFLKDHTNINQVFLCLDNDERGQKAANKMAEKLFEKRIQNQVLIPKNKDWNEDLLLIYESESENQCHQLQL